MSCRVLSMSPAEESSKDAGALRLVDQGLVDVRDDAAARDRRLDQRVELLVTADRELEVARRDALHLEVLARVARELEHLGREVLEDGRRVHGRRGAHALRRRHAQLEEAVEAAGVEGGWGVYLYTTRVARVPFRP